jgi:hypothetical protein
VLLLMTVFEEPADYVPCFFFACEIDLTLLVTFFENAVSDGLCFFFAC